MTSRLTKTKLKLFWSYVYKQLNGLPTEGEEENNKIHFKNRDGFDSFIEKY